MTDSSADAGVQASSSKPPRRRRNWRRRFAWILGTLLVLSIIFRLMLPLLFPVVLKKVAASFNLDAKYERSEFNLLSGDAGLWHLTLTPQGSTAPIFEAGYVRGNIATMKLLTGSLEVWRVEADGVDLTIERNEDGRIPLLEQLLAAIASPAPGSPTASAAPTKYDLAPPLRIDALRLNNVKTILRDKSVTPPVETSATLDLRLSDVGSLKRPANFELVVLSDNLVDQFRASGVARGSANSVDADGFVIVRGLNLTPLEPYLAPLGIKPVSNSISMAGSGKIRVATTQTSSALDVTMDLRGMKAESEGTQTASCDLVTVKVGSVNGSAAKISSVHIDGVHANAGRSREGRLRFAGIELIPVSSTPTTQPSSPLNYAVAIDEVKITNVALTFDDSGITPPATLGMTVDDLTLTNIVLDPANPNASMQIAGQMHSPGLTGEINVSGSATPGATEKKATLKVSVQNIKPDALKPYLDAVGLQSLLKNARFDADVNAAFTPLPTGASASANFTNIKFSDGADLFAMPAVNLNDVTIDTVAGGLDIGTILLTGPTLAAQREASGAVQLLGLRFDPSRLPNTSSTPATTQLTTMQPAQLTPAQLTPAQASPALPRVHLRNLQWNDIKLQFTDHTVSPASTISLANAGVELHDLLLDLTSRQAGKPGTLKAWVEAPNFAERVDVDGTFTPSPASFAANIKVTGKGITAAGAKPYLQSLGIEPVLQNGAFHVIVNSTITQSANAVNVELGVKDAALNDGDEELLGLDSLAVEDLTLGTELNVVSVQIDRPRATVTRLKDGKLQLAGIRTITLPPSTQPVTPEDPNTPLLPPVQLNLPRVLAKVQSLAVNGASVRWIDHAAPLLVDTTATVNASLNDLVYGTDAPPAKYALTLKVKDSLEKLDVSGNLGVSFDRLQLTANAKGNGLKAGNLASYLPTGITGELKDGSFAATLEASILPAAPGGTAASLAISNVSYADSQDQLFKLDSFKLLVPRYDPAGGVVQIDEVSSEGLAVNARKLSSGAIQTLGFAVASVPATQPAQEVSTEVSATQPALVATTGPATEDVAAIVARTRRPLPAITLKKLDLNVASVKFTDESRAGSAPVELKSLNFANLSPIELGGKDPENCPPVKVRLTAKLDPVIGNIDVNTVASPLAQQPTLTTDVLLSGINGEGLTKLLPELASKIDGASLTSGEFRTHLEATAKYQRRGPYDFDLTKGFDLNLLVKDIAYRATPDGEVLLGLESLQAEAIRVEPQKGNVIAKSVELTKPVARALRDKEGIHLLGFTIKEPGKSPQVTADTSATDTSTPKADTPAATNAEEQVVVVAKGPRPKNEIRIDKFLISGGDIRIEDRSTDPPMVIPISSLDIEVRGLSNQAMYEELPIKFTALINSGKTALPKMTRSGLDETNLEDREVFSQIASSGNISLYPKLSGWAKTSVNGFEVIALRGPAGAAGVNIGGGMYDSTIDARVNETGKIELRMRHVMTSLKMTEGDNGPIRKALKLPSPLNVIIAALEDPDSSITLPVSVAIDQGEIKGIGGAVAGAVSSVILTAVASAPVKAVGGVTGLIGLTGKKGKPIEPVVIQFASGDTGVNSQDLAKLDTMLNVLRKEKMAELTLKGDIGGGDVERAFARANPPTSDVSGIASSLRQQKMLLLQERSTLAGAARAQIATNDVNSDATLARIRDLDRQLSGVEDAMDNTYDLLRPGADRQADRRTRAAALQIAQDRMEHLKQAILSYANFPADSERVRVNRPTYAPTESNDGGTITVTLVAKKKG